VGARRGANPSLIAAVLHQIMRSNPRGTYIDIEANIGVMSVPLAINSQWAFQVFEPDPLDDAGGNAVHHIKMPLNKVRLFAATYFVM
jgi:hypothetical protein